jgi:PAS domain S-box-containing protein
VVETLAVDPRSVRAARELVRQAMEDSAGDELRELASLAVSELVTNAIVHTGTEVTVRVTARKGAARVEVEDRGHQLPLRREHADAAGTGRGLALVEDVVDRWGVTVLPDGKVVWFEVGGSFTTGEPAPAPAPRETVRVVLHGVPVLMHAAWQEHAAALLREYLLFSLADDPAVLDRHAAASEAMALLGAQLPAPRLQDDPAALFEAVAEPGPTVEEVVLEVPVASVGHFGTLDELLARATLEAAEGHFLSPPTQPEVQQLRQWLCTEVSGQARGLGGSPWAPAYDDEPVDAGRHAALTEEYADLADAADARVTADEENVVVAVTPAALTLLGYDTADRLVGRRVTALVPERFRQAHVAGTTMHATNGRDVLIDVPVRVPVVRADGGELPVDMTVVRTLRPDGRAVFVAVLQPVQGTR